MTKVIFQPAGNAGGRDHYADTIANPVPVARIAQHVPAPVLEELRSLTKSESIPVWGVTPGANGINERKWDRVDPGDLALFLQSGHAVSAGRVLMKAHLPELARDLWGNQADGQTWEFVYFLAGVKPVDISYAQLNAAAGYKAGNQFMGFTVLEGPQTDGVISLVPSDEPLPRVRFPRVWCVRAGHDLTALTQFIEQGVVGVGWNDIGDPRSYGDDTNALKDAIRRKYPKDNADSAAGVYKRFLSELARGDVILTPTTDAVWVGRILGDARHEETGTFRTVRPVEWATTIKKDSMTDPMRRGLSPQLSVFRVVGGADEWLQIAERGPRSVPRPAEPTAWLVRQSAASRYRDLEGFKYEYPIRIPNGRQIQADDVLVCYRNQDEADGRPIFGVGRIGHIEELADQRVAVYDRYLALSTPAAWADLGNDPRSNPRNSINSLSPEYLDRLLSFVGISSIEELPVVEQPIASAMGEPLAEGRRAQMTMEDLIEITHWTRPDLEQLCDLIKDRAPQVILAGPPGTSKTWVARNVCRYLTQGEGQRFKIVQFHPSYSYEEFVEGLRPDANEQGVIVFRPVAGALIRMVEEAGVDRGPHILLIDEMNRANLPKVLGELMYLFEYRNEAIDLRYRTAFSLPASLRFVGTMNTADRSIRSIDSALRRRFAIVECPPDRHVLERYYTANQNEIGNLFDGFEKLNKELATKLDRHHAIGHAFFMQPRLTPGLLRETWKYKVAPLLEEYFFDQPDVAASFAFDEFWPGVWP